MSENRYNIPIQEQIANRMPAVMSPLLGVLIIYSVINLTFFIKAPLFRYIPTFLSLAVLLMSAYLRHLGVVVRMNSEARNMAGLSGDDDAKRHLCDIF
jgi:hypothetical protein